MIPTYHDFVLEFEFIDVVEKTVDVVLVAVESKVTAEYEYIAFLLTEINFVYLAMSI